MVFSRVVRYSGEIHASWKKAFLNILFGTAIVGETPNRIYCNNLIKRVENKQSL